VLPSWFEKRYNGRVMSQYNKYTVVLTGASRGLGSAMAELLIDGRVGKLFCLSRTRNQKIVDVAGSTGVPLEWVNVDLSDSERLTAFAEELFRSILECGPEAVALINNAAVLEPIARFGSASADELLVSQRVNAIAPLLLVNAFLSVFNGQGFPLIIVNVSSGLGERPMVGAGTYSISKAAVNMLTKCVALEQSNRSNAVYTVAASPGIVDTDMQHALRHASPATLPDRDIFVGLYDEKKLQTPKYSAEAILSLLHRNDIASGSVLSLSQLR